MQTLEDFDKRMEELDVDVMTPSDFIRERRRLEQRFVETYRIAAALINPLIKSGEIQDGELVEEWVQLMSLEPYVFPHGSRRRPPDEKPEEPEQKSRESGSFLFRGFAFRLLNRLYSGQWLRMRNSCFGRRSFSSKTTPPA